MKLSTLLLLSILALPMIFGGCQKSPPAADQEAIFGAIQANLHAMEQKNVDAVMETIHPKAAAYESTRELTRMMFADVDVKYQLSDLKLVSATAQQAEVSFVQRMEKTGGNGQFLNNIVAGVHTLRMDNGKWKIFGTRQLKVTGLDGKPLVAPEPPPEATSPAPAPAPAAAPAAPSEKPAP